MAIILKPALISEFYMDELDKNIIFELEKNGRVTSTEIAKKLNVSHLTVTRHMQTMLNDKKTVAVMGMPDPAKIGWQANSVTIIKTCPQKVDDVIDAIKGLINANHIATLIGEYNIALFLGETSWDNMYAHLRQIRELDGVAALDTYNVVKTYKRHVFGGDGFSYGRLDENETPYRLDDIDKKIIHELIRDGRVSFAKLAGKVGEPLSVTRRHAIQLLEAGVVKVQPVIDINRILNVRVGMFVFLKVEQGLIEANAEYLKNCDEIVMVMTLANNADILFLLQATKPEILYTLLNKHLVNLKGVFDTRTYFRSEIRKRYYFKDLKSEIASLGLEGDEKADA